MLVIYVINDISNICWVVLIYILYHLKQSSDLPDSEFDDVVIFFLSILTKINPFPIEFSRHRTFEAYVTCFKLSTN